MSRLVRQLVLATAAATMVAGCEPYRIEYRTRPSYYDRLVDDPPANREEHEDGTIVVYRQVEMPALPDPTSVGGAPGTNGNAPPPPFRMREEMDDGTVVLRAFLPAHVIGNTLNCLRFEEYDLLWNQLLAERTRRIYEREGQGEQELVAFFREHRIDLARMLNRMHIGLSTHETVVENVGDGVIVCRFWPQTAELFEFKEVRIVREGMGLKLLMIR